MEPAPLGSVGYPPSRGSRSADATAVPPLCVGGNARHPTSPSQLTLPGPARNRSLLRPAAFTDTLVTVDHSASAVRRVNSLPLGSSVRAWAARLTRDLTLH